MLENTVEPADSTANPPEPQANQADAEPRWFDAMETTSASAPIETSARAYDYDDPGESYDATD